MKIISLRILEQPTPTGEIACLGARKWFKATFGDKTVSLQTALDKAIKSDNISRALWWITRNLNRKNRIRFACFCARDVLMNFESKYPDDDRPRKAIEAVELLIEHDTKINRDSARSARSAAWLAARSAAWSAARSAAWSAAEAAAWAAEAAAESAEWAAESAEWAAESAEWAAVWAAEVAAWSAAYYKYLEYGLQLLLKQK